MDAPDSLSSRKGVGALLPILALVISCSTVDQVKAPLPPAGTSPSGAELVADEPQTSSDGTDAPETSALEEGPTVEADDYYDLGPETEPVLEEDLDSVTTESDSPDDDSLVVIDTGAKDLTERPETLAEAARAERERRNIAPPTDIVITDKTLSEYATGDLTVAETSSAAVTDPSELSEFEEEMAKKEAYWRNTARQIRQEWRDAYESIEELETKVFELRQQFYREDDGFYRDAEIKPAWDRAIDQLEEARLEVEAKQLELEEFLQSGREAGALPGWLREGIELEPEPLVEESPTAEPTEPVIYEPQSSDPP